MATSENIPIILDNLLLLTDCHTNLHFEAYLYLKHNSNIFIYMSIGLSTISGLLELLNFEGDYSRYINLISAIISFVITMIIAAYKQLGIAENQQSHWHTSNGFNSLYNDLNAHNMIIRNSIESYPNPAGFIKEYTSHINLMIEGSPTVPVYILKKFNLKRHILSNLTTSSSDSPPPPINNNTTRIQSTRFPLPLHIPKMLETEIIIEKNTNPLTSINMKNSIKIDMDELEIQQDIKEVASLNIEDRDNLRNFVNSAKLRNTKKVTRKRVNIFDIP
jgi:hypothetical protein